GRHARLRRSGPRGTLLARRGGRAPAGATGASGGAARSPRALHRRSADDGRSRRRALARGDRTPAGCLARACAPARSAGEEEASRPIAPAGSVTAQERGIRGKGKGQNGSHLPFVGARRSRRSPRVVRDTCTRSHLRSEPLALALAPFPFRRKTRSPAQGGA